MKKAINFFLLIFVGCSSSQAAQTVATQTATLLPAIQPTGTQTPFSTTTPQPFKSTNDYGPDDFPSNVNPLTGRAVPEPSLLQLPAVLVSISNSPASARPQAGPGFAPWVFELFIGEGATRFMNVFYGDIPRDVPNIFGDCDVRDEIIRPNSDWVGNRVWLDENGNGIQDEWEMGVGGVCVMLFRNSDYENFWMTTTDSNGYYAIEIPKDNTGKLLDGDYELMFDILDTYKFTKQNIGNEDTDSDVDPTTKQIPTFKLSGTDPSLDAGLILSKDIVALPNPDATTTPNYIPSETYVGPIRSGRLTYNQIGGMFPNSCLVYASAAYDIGERLDACEIVYGVDMTTPNSALTTVSRLRELAKENLNAKQPVNYSGNFFSDEFPNDGLPANEINVFYHAYNQSAWMYDPISQTYLRFTDDADGKGILHPATDRLTKRQLAFENVIVVLAEHIRFRHNQFEVNFGNGKSGYAYLFRDGQVFKINWSTTNREYEKTSGLRRPMHFVDAQGKLVPLHPGRIWIHIVTPFSSVAEQGNAEWLVKFVQPHDPPDTPVP